MRKVTVPEDQQKTVDEMRRNLSCAMVVDFGLVGS